MNRTGSLKVRAAQPADAPAIEALLDAAAEWLRSRGIEQWRPGQFAAEVHTAIAADQMHVATRDSRPIGCFRLASDSPPAVRRWLSERGRSTNAAYLSRLAVAREAAGEGIGAQLLNVACRLAANKGLPYLRLDCWAGNTRLREYYLAAGFDHCGDIRAGTPDRTREVVTISLFERDTSRQPR